MFCISIQIQPPFAAQFDRNEFLSRARLIRSPEVDAYEEKGKSFLHFNFFTEFPAQLWQQIHTGIYQDPTYGTLIASQSLVVCEDEDSDECLLLHHFDSAEKLDHF